jgi:hypothetical protein
MNISEIVQLVKDSDNYLELLDYSLRPEPEIRMAVANNENIGFGHIFELHEDAEPSIRQAIARSHSCTSFILSLLSYDEDSFVRTEVARRSIDLKVLRRLMNDDSELVSHEAKQRYILVDRMFNED